MTTPPVSAPWFGMGCPRRPCCRIIPPGPGSEAGGPVRPGCTGPAPRFSARPLKGVELKWRSCEHWGSRWATGCLTPSTLCGFTGEPARGPYSEPVV